LDLHKEAAPILYEWCDEVLFATYRVSTIKREEGFGQTRTRAVGSGERVVYTCEAPTHQAKRRIDLPDPMLLDFSAYQSLWPTPTMTTKNAVEGVVVNGSSKKEKANV